MGSSKKWLNGRPVDGRPLAPEARLEAARGELLAVLEDCHGTECDRLRWRVHMAERAQELWLLRDAAFQAVAYQHCHEQAVQRINGLEPAFQAVLPAHLVTRL